MAPLGTMVVQFSDEDRAAIASAEDVIKRQDAKIAKIERIAVERLDGIRAKVEDVASAAAEYGERLAAVEAGIEEARDGDPFAGQVRALGDRMTALEKMLTGYVADLNTLADRHSAYMMETRLMVERLDKISGARDKGQVADLADLAEWLTKVERRGVVTSIGGDAVDERGHIWRLVAPEIYEGLPRDITAPIGAIIQGLSERVEELEREPQIPSPGWIREVADRLAALERYREEHDGWIARVEEVGHNNRGGLIDALAGRKRLETEVADVRASVKVLGEDITAVGDRLGDHLDAGEDGTEVADRVEQAYKDAELRMVTRYGPTLSGKMARSNTALEERLGNIEMRLDTIDNYIAQDTAAASAYVPAPEHANDHPAWMDGKGGNFDHDYLSRACEQAVAELAADLVKRVKQIARAADADEVPF